jgi:CHAT domain-containing protein
VRALDDRGVIRAAPLPGALDEGREVLEIAGPGQLHQGSQATVDALRELRSPVILHIATHGFSDRQDLQAVVEGMREALFGSGILLAGFNSVMSGVPVGADLGQGFLTGEDASTLSLGATQMVVLSACRTGLGAAVPREGIFGLHRAFAAAGAATVVMSLWKIPDRQTGELMALFYRHLRAGSSRAQALREAKRSVRDRYPHPFFWGAFLCHGDWRVIPGWKSNAQLSSQVTELPK